jgi:hypothetical protein
MRIRLVCLLTTSLEQTAYRMSAFPKAYIRNLRVGVELDGCYWPKAESGHSGRMISANCRVSNRLPTRLNAAIFSAPRLPICRYFVDNKPSYRSV